MCPFKCCVTLCSEQFETTLKEEVDQCAMCIVVCSVHLAMCNLTVDGVWILRNRIVREVCIMYVLCAFCNV